MVRDQALAASGLLVENVGGPSVKPYQPAGLWKELGDADYVQGHGADLYRRSLYTFWKRTVPGRDVFCYSAPKVQPPIICFRSKVAIHCFWDGKARAFPPLLRSRRTPHCAFQ